MHIVYHYDYDYGGTAINKYNIFRARRHDDYVARYHVHHNGAPRLNDYLTGRHCTDHDCRVKHIYFLNDDQYRRRDDTASAPDYSAST